jgi:ABC-type glycerol-3-phosphate transport system permease component
MGSSTYIYSEQLKTINYAIGQITSVGVTRQGVAAAGTVFIMIVPIIIFIVSQSNIIETMGSSGMKD